jgi:hypothetical protein
VHVQRCRVAEVAQRWCIGGAEEVQRRCKVQRLQRVCIGGAKVHRCKVQRCKGARCKGAEEKLGARRCRGAEVVQSRCRPRCRGCAGPGAEVVQRCR